MRGLWAQRLLWEVGGNVALLPATAKRLAAATDAGVSSCSSQLAAVARELARASFKAGALPDMMVEAAELLAAKDFWPAANVELARAWVHDLQAVGYRFPPKLAGSKQDTTQRSATLAPTPSTFLNRGPLDHTFMFQAQWCMRLDTVLVVNQNQPQTAHAQQQIRLLHAAYRPLFRRVLFIGSPGPAWTAPAAHMQALMEQGYFAHCGNYTLRTTAAAFFTYACAADGVADAQKAVWRPGGTAAAANLNMLYINDDVVWSPCMLARLNFSNAWYSDPLNATVDLATLPDGWAHWSADHSGRGSTTLSAIKTAFLTAWGSTAAQAHQLVSNGSVVPPAQGDFYYVPARLQPAFTQLAHHFQSHYVISEVAIRSALGLLPGADLVPFAMAWDGARACIDASIKSVLPLGSSISRNATAHCGCAMAAPWQQGVGGVLALHPIKLSNPQLASWWMRWWLSQCCEG